MSNNSREASGRLSDEEFTKMINGFNANYIDVRDLNEAPELFYGDINNSTEDKLVWTTNDIIEKQLKISNLQKQIAELNFQRKQIICQLERARIDKIFIHELYEDLEKTAEELIDLEKELYFLQQNSEDIIPD